jgi:hypothetical protein
MLYQLPNGRAIEMSTEKYLDMSDTELDKFLAYNQGETIENPFFGSTLERLPPPDISDDDFDEFLDENLIDITDLSSLEKQEDLDLDQDYFEE